MSVAMQDTSTCGSPQSLRVPRTSPKLTPEPEDTDTHEFSEDAKFGAKRHPSPLKTRHKPVAPKSMEDLLKATSLRGTCDDKDLAHEKVNEAVDAAQRLLEDKNQRDVDFKTSIEHLPLLKPGDIIRAQNIGFGFRMYTDDRLEYSNNGDVRVLSKADVQSRCGDIVPIITTYESGCAWMYWSNELMGPNNKTLEQCVMEYGMSGYERADLKLKGIYLTDPDDPNKKGTKFSPDNFFTIMLENAGKQIRSKRNEDDSSTYRVHRSCLPPELKNLILARELTNVRQGVERSSWWVL